MDSKTPTMNMMMEAPPLSLFAAVGGTIVTWLGLFVSFSSQINPILQTIALALGITSSIYTLNAVINKRSRVRRRKQLP